MFDYEGPATINAIHDLTVGVFEHLAITSNLDPDLRVKYIERILHGSVLKNIDRSCWIASIRLEVMLVISGHLEQKNMLP